MRFLCVLTLSLAATACSGSGGDVASAPATPPGVSSPPTIDAAVPDGPEILSSAAGRLRGVRDNGSLAWRGIPYAAPPTGVNRWRAPQPVTPWSDVRDATKFGAKCVQTAPDTSTAAGGSEDCLTLNVWRPDKPAPEGGFPVMFFIHGGYNVRGSSADELEPGILSYHPKNLVARDVVFVSINYRMGALGWMGHASLAAESSHASSGNYGALDQIAALSWVKDNARAIGADPSRVLVFGQSAGATNTCALVASPLAAGLFSRAVMHSGTCGMMAPGKAEAAGASIAEALGCKSAPDILACMRAKPAAEVVAATTLDFKAGGFAWGHSIDGWLLPASVASLVIGGRHNHVPLAIGVTAHETTSLWGTAYPTIPVPKTALDHESAMRTIFGAALADKVIARYPTSAYSSPAFASVAATTDASFVCPARALASAASRSQTEPVRRFYFRHVLDQGPARAFGAAHGFDLLFLFRPEGLSFFSPTEREIALSNAMIGYLTRFAASGDPNDKDAVSWPPYDALADTQIVFDDTIGVESGLRAPQCDFWEAP